MRSRTAIALGQLTSITSRKWTSRTQVSRNCCSTTGFQRRTAASFCSAYSSRFRALSRFFFSSTQEGVLSPTFLKARQCSRSLIALLTASPARRTSLFQYAARSIVTYSTPRRPSSSTSPRACPDSCANEAIAAFTKASVSIDLTSA
jgi:hypothetical protein